ncbi:hypothetical protein RI367_005319 [Sorochytrium milnesiophthora]
MEAYPPEFLVHPAPLVAFIGLAESAEVQQQPAADVVEQVRRQPSFEASPFAVELRASLRQVLQVQGAVLETRPGVVVVPKTRSDYDSQTHRYGWHVVFMDKAQVAAIHRPQQQPPLVANPAAVKHSSLSPSTPGSPVHPDGIMTPLWHRKYLERTPAVTVAVFEMWEQARDGSPTRNQGFGIGKSATSLERERDVAMATRISELKKLITDIGGRFFVWLVVRNPNVDDSILEERFSQIRRASGLDNRSLFVISQSGRVSDFCSNFPRYCGEASARFYQNIASKIKRKRNKPQRSPTRSILGTQVAGGAAPATDLNASALSPAAWAIRYDYKLAVLSEIRGDIEEAQRHYQVAYRALGEYMSNATASADMRALFANLPRASKSPQLTVFSKRWFEAKILLDIMNFKIMKLCMLGNSPLAALSHFHAHLDQLSQLPDAAVACPPLAFAYYEWLVRQHRVFAELLDSAGSIGVQIPYLGSGAGVVHSSSSMSLSSLYLQDGPMQRQSPASHQPLQHSGFWYFEAARLNVKRQLSLTQLPAPDSAATLPPQFTAMLQSERKVDHYQITIDLLTKSYEQFKARKNARMTFFLASEIAKTHQQSGNHQMALQFFERIAKSYRKEGWGPVLRDILSVTAQCATSLGARSVLVQSSVELLSATVSDSPRMLSDAQETLLRAIATPMVQTSVDAAPDLIRIEMDQINPFIRCTVQFEKQSGYVQQDNPLQITLSTHGLSPSQPISMSRLDVEFSDATLNTSLVHDMDAPTVQQQSAIQLCRALNGRSANLLMHKGLNKVVELCVRPAGVMDLQAHTVTLHLTTDTCDVALVYNIKDRKQEGNKARRWLSHNADHSNPLRWTTLPGFGELTTLRVLKQLARVTLKLEHQPPVLLDEWYRIQWTMCNSEVVDVIAALKIDLKGSDGTEQPDVFFTEDPSDVAAKQPRQYICGPVTLNANETRRGVVWMRCQVVRSEQMLGSSVHYMHATDAVRHIGAEELVASVEAISVQDTARVVFLPAFETTTAILRQPCSPVLAQPLLSDSRSLSATAVPLQEWHERYMVFADVKLMSPWDVAIGSIVPVPPSAQAFDTSVQMLGGHQPEQASATPWKPGQVSRSCFEVTLRLKPDVKAPPTISPGTLGVVWRRDMPRSAEEVTGHEAQYTQPILMQSVGVPFCLTYTVTNAAASTVEFTATLDYPPVDQEKLMFSGPRHTLVRLLPFHATQVAIHCVPLCVGSVGAPTLRCTWSRVGGPDGNKISDVVTNDPLLILVKQ